MADNLKSPRNIPPVRRRRVHGNKFVTKSGETVKIRRTLSEKSVARREAKLARKAYRLRGLPKSRVKRFFWRLHPKRVFQYWFSRDGLIMALKISGVGIVVAFFTVMAVFAYFRKDLPSLKDISGNTKGGSVRYYDSSGKTLLWEDYNAVKRVPVEDDKISQFMKDATVAIEDRDFFSHGGFDTKGIIRAVYNNARGKSTQGGSTITQQLVKLTTPGFDQDRSVTRKVKELILSVETERSYSKKEILSAYLNVAPYGGIEYGVEVAAQTYFQKSAKDLTLAESAFLAAIPKSPYYYSYYSSGFDKESLVGRTEYILNILYDEGKITKQQRDEAKKTDVVATVHERKNNKYSGIIAPYFVLAAQQQLINKFTLNTYDHGGWKVITTVDMNLQKTAEDLVAKNFANIQRLTNGAYDEQATVLEDVQTGQIKALVGGVNFNADNDHAQINYASNVLIPPGSTFKPYDYAAFIENNTTVGASSVLYDSYGPLPGYVCTKQGKPSQGGNCLRDYDGLTPGAITLRYALGGSRNIPAVKAMLSAIPNDKSNGKIDSINKTISTASAMMANPDIAGNAYNCYSDEALKTTTQCYGSAAIGDGAYLYLDDHTNGISTLARLGNAIPKTYILKVTDANNKSLYEWKQPQGKQVIRPDTAFIVNDMAADPNASYLAGSLNGKPFKFHKQPNGWRFAIKTGTTNDDLDGLMASWSTKYAVVSWVGNHTRKKASTAFKEYLTTPLTRELMIAAHANLPPVNWTKPATVLTLPGFVQRTKVHNGDIEPGPTNDYYPGWYVAPSAKPATKQVFDKVSGKIATDCTPELAKEERSDTAVGKYSVDIFAGGSANSTTSQDKDDVHKCDDVKPSVTFTVEQTSTPGIYSIRNIFVTAGSAALNSGKFPGTLTFSIDGQVIEGGSVSVLDSGSLPNITYKSTYEDVTGKDIVATVTDSSLYTSTATVGVNPIVKYTGN